MWYPVSLKIVNIFSHEKTYFEFHNNSTTIINGVNNTDDGVRSNGSGKTSILDCISIGIVGEPLRDISKKEIVRNGEKSGEITFVLKNNVLGKELKILREINSTKSSNALIWENGVPNDKLKDLEVKETNKYILSLLGIAYEDLVNYFLISKDSYQSFFLNGDVAKKEIINRFSKANMIDPVDPLIKTDIEDLDSKITVLTNQISSNKGILEHHIEELNVEKLESSIEKTRKLTINSLQEKHDIADKLRSELPELIKAKKIEIEDQNKITAEKIELKTTFETSLQEEEDKKSKVDEKLSKVEKDRVTLLSSRDKEKDVLETQIADSQAELKELNSNLKEANELISELDTQLAGQIECPDCNFKFVLQDKEFNVEEGLVQKKEFEEIRDEALELIVSKKEEIEELEKKEEQIGIELKQAAKALVDKKTRLAEEITLFNKLIDQLKKDIKALNDSIKKEEEKLKPLEKDLNTLSGKETFYLDEMELCKKAIKEEEDKEYPNKAAEIQVKIDTLTKQNEELQEKADKHIEEKASLLEWQVRFKQFKSFLANTSISAIQEMTNFFLQKMGTSLSVKIEGYRELANKKLKEEITTLVTRDGLNGESFSKFSGGEKARVDIACILAMQKIINIASEGGGLNLLFIDEILESVDATALSGVVKALSELDQTIFLITHVETTPGNYNSLTVVKTNGISEIIS
jgi:exonuclease SbcC